MSQSALAKALDLSEAVVSRLKRRGMPVDSVEAARAWRAANVRPRMAPVAEGAGLNGADYTRAKAQREAAEAQLAELRAARERAELVSAADAARAWADFRVRAERELHGLVDRVVPLLVEVGPDAAGLDEVLRREILGTLAKLSGRAK
ncbi:MAG: hypothetical protein LC125_06765 [Burkholderiales bacterium]|nr:hypothetical protein [Burkholderiales bacterium]